MSAWFLMKLLILVYRPLASHCVQARFLLCACVCCVHASKCICEEEKSTGVSTQVISSHSYKDIQFSSIAQSSPTLCDPMNCSTPSFPVHHHLPEFTQIHVHRVRDAIQPSHPRSSPSLLAPNPSQYQSLFQ